MEVRKLSRCLTLGAAFIATGGAALAAVPAASAQQPLHVGPAGITHIGLAGQGSSSHGGGTTLPVPSGTEESTNWSGYGEDSGTYTSVTTSWTQPSINCSSVPNSYAAFWDGLDGFSSSTVEQDGTLAECVSSGGRHGSQQAEYLAWYEAYPSPMYQFGGAVAPGDALTATVSSASSTSFTLMLSDVAGGKTKWTATKLVTLRSAAARSSAEVIAEAPSSNSGVLPLANFGSVSFTNTSVDGVALSASQNPIPIEMVTQRGAQEAVPSALNGAGFSVTWVS